MAGLDRGGMGGEITPRYEKPRGRKKIAPPAAGKGLLVRAFYLFSLSR